MSANNKETPRSAAWNGYSAEPWIFQEDFDWRPAFEVACRDSISRCEGSSSTVSLDPFAVDDVFLIYASSVGEADGEAWMGVFLLKDGRFVFVTAGCDYSGWG